MSRRISSATAREVVRLWLAETGRRVPSRELSYVDFAIVVGAAPSTATRKQANLYLCATANRILDEKRAHREPS